VRDGFQRLKKLERSRRETREVRMQYSDTSQLWSGLHGLAVIFRLPESVGLVNQLEYGKLIKLHGRSLPTASYIS